MWLWFDSDVAWRVVFAMVSNLGEHPLQWWSVRVRSAGGKMLGRQILELTAQRAQNSCSREIHSSENDYSYSFLDMEHFLS